MLICAQKIFLHVLGHTVQSPCNKCLTYSHPLGSKSRSLPHNNNKTYRKISEATVAIYGSLKPFMLVPLGKVQIVDLLCAPEMASN